MHNIPRMKADGGWWYTERWRKEERKAYHCSLLLARRDPTPKNAMFTHARRRHTHINKVMSFRLPQCGLWWYLQWGFFSLLLSRSIEPSSYRSHFRLLHLRQPYLRVVPRLRVAMSCGCCERRNRFLQPNWEEKTKPTKLAWQFTIASNFFEDEHFELDSSHSPFIRNKSSRKIFAGVECFFFHLICVAFFSSCFSLSHLSPRLM